MLADYVDQHNDKRILESKPCMLADNASALADKRIPGRIYTLGGNLPTNILQTITKYRTVSACSEVTPSHMTP